MRCCVLADLPDADPRYDGVPPLLAPPPEQCVRLEPSLPGGTHVGILDILDFRFDPATVPFAQAPTAELGGRAAGLVPFRRRPGARRRSRSSSRPTPVPRPPS